MHLGFSKEKGGGGVENSSTADAFAFSKENYIFAACLLNQTEALRGKVSILNAVPLANFDNSWRW